MLRYYATSSALPHSVCDRNRVSETIFQSCIKWRQYCASTVLFQRPNMSRHNVNIIAKYRFTKIGSVGRVKRVSQSLSLRKPLLPYHNKESKPKIVSFYLQFLRCLLTKISTFISFALSLLFPVILSSICTRFGVRIAVLVKV
jgi:hypothetical protein